ncbi:precorrin-2 dehydrogenase/sirohydrochlorin ferrochelatase family protein [Paenibacillus pinistramenti]|uniref:precorrin-2 dehydrogenase/sirohydrochlorin ferrochelatase family protein n=1 Tax=Paenibacillus pinistramenti TaxID=1768003 RepID=UPI001109254D|nr:bifunctional precorrin-2 dehydrogenase/sirohydrochlorin ferrochelatase [Paenibacillus pinistramenti]
MAYYIPIMLDCEGLKAVIVGGGRIAARKAAPLLEGGAALMVISPELGSELEREHEAGRITWIGKNYAAGDLISAQPGLVFACTPDEAVNRLIAEEAGHLHIPVNVAARSADGNFITPAVVRRGDLIFSVSASGASPALSRNIAKELASHYGEEFEIYLSLCRRVRQRIKQVVQEPARRAELLNKLTELDILEQIRSGQFQDWPEEQIDEWIVKG